MSAAFMEVTRAASSITAIDQLNQPTGSRFLHLRYGFKSGFMACLQSFGQITRPGRLEKAFPAF